MSKLPQLKPNKLSKALRKLGFKSHPGKGSHIIFYNEKGKYTSIPMHTKPIGKGLLHKILKQIDIPIDEIKKYL